MNRSVQKPEPFLSKRPVRWAGLAAVIACAACCALPLLLAAGVGSGATIMRFLQPGAELIAGGAVFAMAVGVIVIRARAKRRPGCGPSCQADGGCCDRSPSARSA